MSAMTPYDAEISLSPRADDASVKPTTFRRAIRDIKTGTWAPLIENVRNAHQRHGKEGSDRVKKTLPGIIFAGKFSKRSAANLIQHSGLICADLDHLGDQVGAYKERFASDPHVLAVFVSPTGTGLKAIFRCDPERSHKQSFEAMEHYVIQNFGVTPDEKCSDSSRLCFVSHDPELEEVENAEVIPYPPPRAEAPQPKPANPPTGELKPGDDFNARAQHLVPDLLRKHGWTHFRGKYWCRPGKENAVSASWDVIPGVFHPFSNSPETRLPTNKEGFDAFALYTHLEHGGDFKAAARQLHRDGYGSQTEPRKVIPPAVPASNGTHPTRQEQNLEKIAGPAPKPTGPLRKPSEFHLAPATDPSSLLGNRYLNRGDGLVISGQSGCGKSSMQAQMAEAWSLGEDFMGIRPASPLSSLIVQSEDSDGDIAEAWQSIRHVRQRTASQSEATDARVRIVTDRVNRGARFLASLRQHIAEFKPDLVWINPLQAFVDGDITSAKDIGAFLREGLNGLNEPATFGIVLIHHTTKPATGKDRHDRLWHEQMYDMAGGAEIINWARAIISIKPQEEPGTFSLRLAKRGRRAGVTREVEQGAGVRMEPVTEIGIRHSTGKLPGGQPIIFWESMAMPDKKKIAGESGGRPSKYKFTDYRPVFPTKQSEGLPLAVLHRALEAQNPIKKDTLFHALKRWAADGDVEIVSEPGKPDRYRAAL